MHWVGIQSTDSHVFADLRALSVAVTLAEATGTSA